MCFKKAVTNLKNEIMINSTSFKFFINIGVSIKVYLRKVVWYWCLLWPIIYATGGGRLPSLVVLLREINPYLRSITQVRRNPRKLLTVRLTSVTWVRTQHLPLPALRAYSLGHWWDDLVEITRSKLNYSKLTTYYMSILSMIFGGGLLTNKWRNSLIFYLYFRIVN